MKKKLQEEASKDPEMVKEDIKAEEKPKAQHEHPGAERQSNHCMGHDGQTNIYNHYHNQVIHQHQVFYQNSSPTPHE